MSKHTNIEWCDSTINGSSGCDGCELWNETTRICYAGNLHEGRLALSMPDKYAPDFYEVRMIPGRFAQAAAWGDLRGTERPDKPWLNGLPRMIFVGDMGDFLSRRVTDEFLMHELFGAIQSDRGKRHFWMLLTKRPRRLAELSRRMGGLPFNCMAMTTVTAQDAAGMRRIYELLQVECRWRGLSAEPLLGPLNLNGLFHRDVHFSALERGVAVPHKLDLVIVGGESGNGARETDVVNFMDVVDDCQQARVPVFVKQLGSRPVAGFPPLTVRHKKGGDPAEWPPDLRVREFPRMKLLEALA